MDKSLDLADLNITSNSRLSKMSQEKHKQSIKRRPNGNTSTQELQDESALFAKFLQGSEGIES